MSTFSSNVQNPLDDLTGDLTEPHCIFENLSINL